MSSKVNPPKPTNIKMNPRFSFTGSTSKGFKAGFNRRGSNCTALTEQSPATTSDENEGSEDSFQSGSSSYESSSYDDSMESSEEESDSQYDQLMNDLPFAGGHQNSGPASNAAEMQMQNGQFTPMQMSMHGVIEESEGDITPVDEEHDSCKEGHAEESASSSFCGEHGYPIANGAPMDPLATTAATGPTLVPAYPEEIMGFARGDAHGRDACMTGESSASSSGESEGSGSTSMDYENESSSAFNDMVNELPVAVDQKAPVVVSRPVGTTQVGNCSLPFDPRLLAQMQGAMAQRDAEMNGDEEEEDDSSEYDDSDEIESSSESGSFSSEEDGSSTGYSDLMKDLPAQPKEASKVVRQPIKRRDSVRECLAPPGHGVVPQENQENHDSDGFSVEEDDSEEESSSYDSDESSGSEYSTDDEDMDGSDSESEDSSDWSSSDGSSYNALMQEMVQGRKAPISSPQRESRPPVGPTAPGGFPAGLPIGLPGVPVPSTDIPCEDPPMEGLAMLQNIRAELQKVGNMIVKNKDGEKFLQRAQILTSINYLASNVPRCILEDLGQEIKDQLQKQEERKKRKQKSKNVMNSLVRVRMDDDDSVASDLSHVEDHAEKSFADSVETDSDMEEEEDDFFPDATTPETIRRKYTLENFIPMKNPMGIRESRLSMSTHSSGHMLAPRLREETCPERRGASRTYSFASASLSSTSSESEWSESDTLPIMTYFECALLFVDISGFTKLSTLLDPENLSKVINTYFELLVSHVNDFNGDIQKFAGDALYAEFRATPKCPLSKCCELAAACAASLVRDCSDFPVSTICGLMDADADGIPASLNVHCGLGIGEMAGLHIGDNENRREYLYLGNPIKQTAQACDYAHLGEAAASREFCQYLDELDLFTPDLSKNQEAFVIAERGNSLLRCNEAQLLAAQRVNARSRSVAEHVQGLEPESLKEYRRLLSLYVHPVAVSNDVAAENDFTPSSRVKDKNNSRERQLEEAELRSVYTMFVSPKVSIEMTGDAAQDAASVEIVHDIMKIANRELRKYNGHMRQFVMDDKGMVFIATFGLRGSTFPNMVGERALPATIAIHNALQFELGVEANIGATFGDVYCGAVGGEKRHEYAVMGPSVNLAARLMANKSNPGILVDKAVRKLASESFAFNALPPVQAKGYKDLVHIFEPLSSVERGWGKIIPNFVGREEEMQKITQIASHFYRKQHCSNEMIIIKSSTGMGKSTLLAHSIDKVKKVFVSKRARIGIAKHVGRESHSMKPFCAAAHLLRIMLAYYKGCFDDMKSVASGKDSCYSSIAGSVNGDSNSYTGDSTVLSMSQFEDRLEAVFIEIGAPTVHLEYTKALLLEDDVKQEALLPEIDGEMVTTFATAFARINGALRLSVLAIDDAHHCDEASWLVFQEVFISSENTLFLGTTSGGSLSDTKINKPFLTELEDKYTSANRFHSITLGNLSREEVKHMIMKTMALQKHEVTDSMLDTVFNQSLGMPLVANNLVSKIKQNDHGDNLMAFSGTSESVADIFLHKIDGFDTTVRDALNVCALLGNKCTFDDIFGVMSGMSDGKVEDIRKECETSVEMLCTEGILYEDMGEYTFSHELWRTIPLGLMLASRKRDIHRKVAQNLEGKLSAVVEGGAQLEMRQKIFEHWKATGDTTKSSAAALVLRDFLEQQGDFEKCVSIFEDVLALWGWKSDSSDARLAGLSKSFLHHVGADELSNIIVVLIALGRAYAESSRPNIGVAWWENALRVMNSTTSAHLIRDRSIIFPAYDGISKAIQDGHMVQDLYCRYEQAMIRKFIQETRAHGRLIHHIHALFLQMKLYGRQGYLDKGIAVHSIIKSIYKPDKHSEKLRDVYGQDSGALGQALCAYWDTVEGEKKNGLKMCRAVLKDLLPRLDHDFFNMFNLMYPLALAFKEAGYPNEANGFFSKLVAGPFGDCPEDHPLHHLTQVFPAISILFGAANSKKASRSEIKEWANWVVQQRPFGQKLQLELGRFGRCGNSLLAEICLLVADKLQKSDPLRPVVLKKGSELIAEALHFHRKFGIVCAIKPSKIIMNRLRRASRPKKDALGEMSNHNNWGNLRDQSIKFVP